MIARLVLAYATAALAVAAPGLAIAAVVITRTWRDVTTREGA